MKVLTWKQAPLAGLYTAVVFALALLVTACGSSSSGGGGSSSPTYTVGGTVTGLTGTLVLYDDGGDAKSITANGTFAFATALASGAAYSVTVFTQPSGETCSVSNGSGTIAAANVTSVTVSCGAAASAGNLDTGFGTAGYANGTNSAGATGSSEGNQINAVSVDSQGRIVGVGYSRAVTTLHRQMAVWRFTSAGVLDTTFGTNGLFTIANTGGGTYASGDVGNAVVIGPSDSILVSGFTDASSGGGVVWKLTSAGVLDTTFNSVGYKLLPALGTSSVNDSVNGIGLDSSGNVYITGSTHASSTYYMVVARLNSSGTFDTSFGNAATGTTGVFGTFLSGRGAFFSTGQGIVLDSANPANIWVVGGDSNNMIVWKVLPNGTALDTTTFGSGVGAFAKTATTGGTTDYGFALAVNTTSGRLVAAGRSTDGSSNTHSAAWVLTSTGALDTTFGTGGIVTATGAGSVTSQVSVQGAAVALDSTNRVVMTGFTGCSMAVWRYTSAGVADSTFGTSGSSSFADPYAASSPCSAGGGITLDSSGNILVGGDANNAAGGRTAMVWRVAP